MTHPSRIPLLRPHTSGKELGFIEEAFLQNWIAPMGENVDVFESDLEHYFGNDRRVALVNSGTAALHLALILLGVTRGDEVICQSLTFAASANPIVYQGATPVFVDSESSSWNICPIHLEGAIKDRMAKGKKPKAIIAVNLYGMPYNAEAISKLSQQYGIPVIEDAAEAFGSLYKGRHCGTLGDLSILSFNGSKIITTSGGGALVVKTNEDKERAIFLASQAKERAVHYEHNEIGYNYRLSNISAGIGRGQFTALDDRISQKHALHQFYKQGFSEIPGISLFTEFTERIVSNHWLNCIQVTNKSKYSVTEIAGIFEAAHIETRPIWKPMHMQPVFKDAPYYGNGVSEKLFASGLCLPSATNLTTEEKHRINNVLQSLA
ncbi:MAG: DegT/DnrJ/EryC1/StrS family aminotransferase [Bacteroidetes bacterium]|nr:DegT/DnrJ/EryC1/StrS family aminotransferase [Bacteroidota bacterium]